MFIAHTNIFISKRKVILVRTVWVAEWIIDDSILSLFSSMNTSAERVIPINVDPDFRTGNNRLSDLDILKMNAAYGCKGQTDQGCSKHIRGFDGTVTMTSEENDCQVYISVRISYIIHMEFQFYSVLRAHSSNFHMLNVYYI